MCWFEVSRGHIQSDLFTTSPLVVLPYTSIQSDLFTTSSLVVLPYTSIQSDLFVTSQLRVCMLVYVPTHLTYICTPLSFCPRCTAHPEVAHSGSDLISIDAGRTIAVLCFGTGVNDPQVLFRKDSTVLQSSGKFEISPNSQSYKIGHFLLYNSAVNDAGSYSCRAFNFLSTSTAPFQIAVVDPCK